jgi:nucleoside-diphosphate-sugar epimerase
VVDVGLAALERGTNGARYLACGRAEDVCTLPELCNRALELAGLPHRMRTLDVTSDAGYSNYYARLELADPMVDPSQTAEALGVTPTSRDEGLRRTLAWLREVGKI